MGFSGWPEVALDFYDGLEEDNSKSYWTAHKAVYDQAVLGPMTELTEELAPEFGAVKIFRPYRDVRFSADKTPYKTGIGAVVGPGYVQFSGSGLAAGSGMHQMAPDQIARYRQAVDEDLTGHELERVIETITKAGYEVHGRDPLKTAPRGYQADHPRIDLLRNKGLVAWQEWPIEPWLSTAAVKDKVADFFRIAQPLDEWLENHVGPSDQPESRRR
jgi:uncharacterized protein (TIGR02453 family)